MSPAHQTRAAPSLFPTTLILPTHPPSRWNWGLPHPKDVQHSSIELIQSLLNGLLEQLDIDVEFVSLRILLYRVVKDPGSVEELQQEVQELKNLSDVPTHSRLFITAVARTSGRDIPLITTVFVNADRRVAGESKPILPLVPLESKKEARGLDWRKHGETAAKALPTMLRTIDFFLR